MTEKLAILGGRPVRRFPFPDYPRITSKDISAVTDVLKSGELSTFHRDFLGGEKVQLFEERFAEWHGIRYAIAVNSGTAALHVAIAAAGIGQGDEVIVPAFTFTATASAVCMAGAVPVFADVDPHTFNIDIQSVKKLLTDKTQAVIPVHLLGNPADMTALEDLQAASGVLIIGDCAQALGAERDARKVGTFGIAGCFSFQETKTLSIGEGGMVITDNEIFADKCRLVRNHGEAFLKNEPRPYMAKVLGWNYRMTEMEAALGASRFERIDKELAQRRELAQMLDEGVARIPFLTPQKTTENVIHGYSLYGLYYDEKKAGASRRMFLDALRAEGIPFSAGYPHPVYMNPIFEGKPGLCPNAEHLCEKSAIWTQVIQPPATRRDMKDVLDALDKVSDRIGDLAE